MSSALGPGRYFNTVDPSKGGHEQSSRRSIACLDLILLDGLGYLPLARSSWQLLFHLISKLNEQSA